MNDEPPSPFDIVGDEPVEARIVAWVLGEASAFEAAELVRLCEERPELLVFRRRMRALHGLLTEAEASEADHSWKLPPEKRRLLDEISGEEMPIRLVPDREQTIRHSGRRAALAIAACLMISFVVFQLIPKQYEGKTVVEVKPRNGGLSPLGSAAPAKTASPAQPSAPAEMTMSLAKAKEGLNDVQQDKKRTRLAGTGKLEQPAIAMLEASNLQAVPIPSASGWSGSASAGGGSGFGGGKSGFGSTADPFAETSGLAFNTRESDEAVKGDKVTSGLRSGNQAIDRNSIDAILNNPSRLSDSAQVAPATAGSPLEQKALTDGPADAMPTLAAKDSTSRPARPRIVSPASATAAGQPMQQAEPQEIFTSGNRKGQVASDQIVEFTDSGGTVRKLTVPKITTRSVLSSEESIKAASQLRAEGKYSEARSYLEGIIAADPNNAEAWREKGKLDDPVRSNAALGYDWSLEQNGVLRGLQTPEAVPSFVKAATQTYNLAIQVEGEKEPAKIEIIREFKYPTEHEPSHVDASWHSTAPGNKAVDNSASSVDYYQKANETPDQTYNLTRKFQGDGKPMGVENAGESKFAWDLQAKLLPKGEVEAAQELFTRTESDGDKSGGKDRGESTENTIQSEYKSAYLFKGLDLSSDAEPAATLLDLMEEISASDNPYSTFSLNISDASFQLAKAALAKGERPDPASIKTEQFYNAVDYGDPAPAANEPVAATIEQAAHPVIPGRTLVRVALRTGSSGRAASQPLRLTLLVDQSGSMVREDRRAAMEQALQQLGGLLTKNDSLTIIGFSRTPRLLADGLTGDQAAKLGDIVNQTASEGGTNLEEALKLAAQKAAENQLAGAQNRVVLFTDGAANLGNANPENLAKQVTALRQKGISFDIAGIGADGLNDKLLGELARHGNGRYYLVGSEKNDSFAKQLAGAFRPAAENVKVQMRFNPQRVGNYKLIGFEKDRLKTEDFRNDAVDAAELAAEEAGVAIYQVETLANGSGEIGEVSVRFRDAASKEMVERTWTMPHESSITAFDRATPSMQLAGLSLLAAEKLKGGPLADATDFKLLAEPAAAVKQFYGASPRVGEMLQVIEKLK